MLCNNVAGEMDYGCNGNGNGFGFGNFDCIINLIIILIVLQFLTSIINGTGCGNSCC